MTDALEIGGGRSGMAIDGVLFADEVEVEVTHEYAPDDIFIYWTKEHAIQIVNHLIKVFDITPEQRNK